MGEDDNDTEPAKSTTYPTDTQTEGNRGEEETEQTGGAHPLDSSGNQSADACYEYGHMSAFKTQTCTCWKAGHHCTN